MDNGHKDIEKWRVWGGEVRKGTYENILLTTLLAHRSCMKILDEFDGFRLRYLLLSSGKQLQFHQISFPQIHFP
jgi:hypothetical protein